MILAHAIVIAVTTAARTTELTPRARELHDLFAYHAVEVECNFRTYTRRKKPRVAMTRTFKARATNASNSIPAAVPLMQAAKIALSTEEEIVLTNDRLTKAYGRMSACMAGGSRKRSWGDGGW